MTAWKTATQMFVDNRHNLKRWAIFTLFKPISDPQYLPTAILWSDALIKTVRVPNLRSAANSKMFFNLFNKTAEINSSTSRISFF